MEPLATPQGTSSRLKVPADGPCCQMFAMRTSLKAKTDMMECARGVHQVGNACQGAPDGAPGDCYWLGTNPSRPVLGVLPTSRRGPSFLPQDRSQPSALLS